MRRYKYQWTTADESGEFCIEERSESIANTEAKMHLQRLVNPAALLSFDLVCNGPV